MWTTPAHQVLVIQTTYVHQALVGYTRRHLMLTNACCVDDTRSPKRLLSRQHHSPSSCCSDNIRSPSACYSDNISSTKNVVWTTPAHQALVIQTTSVRRALVIQTTFVLSAYCVRQHTPVKIIEKNGRSNAVLGVRTLQNRSNGLIDVLIPKLNTVIVRSFVHYKKTERLFERRSWHLNAPAVN